MSLRIRRGTDAQRQGITFDLGEPIWTTDTQKLYVGDGITAGGNNILAQSAGTGMTWNATTQKFDVTGGGGGGGGGGITAIVQDTNPTLGGNLALSGHNITGSGNISITGSISASGTGTFTGGLGANLNLNSNTINGTGNINISGTITGTTIATSGLSLNNNVLSVTSGTLYVSNNSQQIVQFKGVNVDGSGPNCPQVNIYSSRGTVTAPVNSQAGDYATVLGFGGYQGSNYQQIASIIAKYDNGATMSNSNPGAAIALVVNNNSGGENIAIFNYNGTFSAPVFQTGSYNSSVAYPTPSAGMIIFDSSNNHFYGYNGTTWKQLDN